MVVLPKYLKQNDGEILEKFRFIQLQEDGRIRNATLNPFDSRYSFGVSVDGSNDRRNRYVNIMPYERNRVKLNVVEGNDYINASYVKLDIPDQSTQPGFYIATQGPTENTWGQFWQMCYQSCDKNSDNIVIVMVTPLVEQGREKCHKYWPAGKNMTDRKLEVEKIQAPGGPDDVSEFPYSLEIEFVKKKSFCNSYVLTTLNLKVFDDGNLIDEKTVHHFYFDQWQDMSKPEEIIPIMKLSEHSHSLNESEKTPIIVHCSAGVGRSGTFIALDHLIHNTSDFHDKTAATHSENNKFVLRPDKEYSHDLIEQIVSQMRAQRIRMVQLIDQYEFIYHAAKYLYESSK